MLASVVKYAAVAAIAAIGTLSPQLAFADPLAAPNGEPVLTISGAVENTNEGDSAVFDLEMLEAMGMESITTKTPWYDAPVTFEGIPMAKLMDAVGASGDTVVAVALNDYTTEIPVSDFKEHGTLLALKRDGEYMPIRDKGPLFIVYPYDSDPDLQDQIYYARSAWQLHQLIVK